MYFKFFKPQGWQKRFAKARRRNFLNHGNLGSICLTLPRTLWCRSKGCLGSKTSDVSDFATDEDDGFLD